MTDIFLFVTNKGNTNATVQFYYGFDMNAAHTETVPANDAVTVDKHNLSSYGSEKLVGVFVYNPSFISLTFSVSWLFPFIYHRYWLPI